MRSLALATTHITSAVLLAAIANTLVTRTLVGAGRAPFLENLGRYMLMAISLWPILRAWQTRPHANGEGYFKGFVAGLVPSPLTLLVMMLALSRDVPEAGLVFGVAKILVVTAVLVRIAPTVLQFCTTNAPDTAFGHQVFTLILSDGGQALAGCFQPISSSSNLACTFLTKL